MDLAGKQVPGEAGNRHTPILSSTYHFQDTTIGTSSNLCLSTGIRLSAKRIHVVGSESTKWYELHDRTKTELADMYCVGGCGWSF